MWHAARFGGAKGLESGKFFRGMRARDVGSRAGNQEHESQAHGQPDSQEEVDKRGGDGEEIPHRLGWESFGFRVSGFGLKFRVQGLGVFHAWWAGEEGSGCLAP